MPSGFVSIAPASSVRPARAVVSSRKCLYGSAVPSPSARTRRSTRSADGEPSASTFVSSAESPAVPRTDYGLANEKKLKIAPVLNGLWQLSGGHGARYDGLMGKKRGEEAVERMFDYVAAGLSTFDCADHYGPSEDLLGVFLKRYEERFGAGRASDVQVLTKWVPGPEPATPAEVEAAIDVSLRRLQVGTLDSLQFHWWEYGAPYYLDVLRSLADLQAKGKIRHLALTNFDTEHLAEIVDAGIPIASNQVQFSVVDRRPDNAMLQYCNEKGIRLLAYGTCAGGLLSEKYLGAPEPRGPALDTYSKSKYKRFVDYALGWDGLQRLLRALKAVADKHSVDVTNVAVRYVMEKEGAPLPIVGCRLAVSDHIQETVRLFSFALDEADHAAINEALEGARMVPGDCGDEYRR
eukprot:tig00021257_g19763.t1